MTHDGTNRMRASPIDSWFVLCAGLSTSKFAQQHDPETLSVLLVDGTKSRQVESRVLAHVQFRPPSQSSLLPNEHQSMVHSLFYQACIWYFREGLHKAPPGSSHTRSNPLPLSFSSVISAPPLGHTVATRASPVGTSTTQHWLLLSGTHTRSLQLGIWPRTPFSGHKDQYLIGSALSGKNTNHCSCGPRARSRGRQRKKRQIIIASKSHPEILHRTQERR